METEEPFEIWTNEDIGKGTKYFFSDDPRYTYHKIKGPAVIDPNGFLHYMQNDKLHRLDGPAVVDPNDGFKIWYYKGKLIECDSQQEFERKIKLLAFL